MGEVIGPPNVTKPSQATHWFGDVPLSREQEGLRARARYFAGRHFEYVYERGEKVQNRVSGQKRLLMFTLIVILPIWLVFLMLFGFGLPC